ncbi:hypothetical protein GCM10023191_061490 [Actinoallomurus oryzae]|uniref:Secreted protein n=1 Tax=Actinoallomurus oryzae TaxID=502180 RepID=A0ABP8QN64_9ACTN
MAPVRRVMTYVTVWGGATALAILLVWFGARPVLHNAVFGEPPAARPLVGGRQPVNPPPVTASPPSDSSTVATPSRTPSPTPRDRTYAIHGGKVVLSVTATAARLVSATPSPGYEMRTWHGEGWLRVDFTKGFQSSSLFATWNGHAPDVRVVG